MLAMAYRPDFAQGCITYFTAVESRNLTRKTDTRFADSLYLRRPEQRDKQKLFRPGGIAELSDDAKCPILLRQPAECEGQAYESKLVRLDNGIHRLRHLRESDGT